jgi:SAM-dependent methyltransferase
VDAYVTQAQLKEKQEVFPIDLYLCGACGHGQLLDVVSPKLLFGNYIYTTSSSPGLVEYFRGYADDVMTRLQLPPGAAALDIGSNDGTLLSNFKRKGLRVLGVDPAQEIANTATRNGLETLAEFFNSKTAANIRDSKGAMDLITANNVFAHSDTLGDMAEGVRLLLNKDGVFVFEVSYLLDMVEKMIFDFIYHEHLSHHSVKPLQTFLRRHGLNLFAVQRTASKGGSIRCFAELADGRRAMDPSVTELIKQEEQYGLYDLTTYQAYAGRIDSVKNRLRKELAELKAKGKLVAGYGAAATSTVLIYHFGLGDSLSYIIDDNPERQNRYSPGHHIPIVSSSTLKERKPDSVVILVWRFAEMIIARNQDYLRDGGRFIVPLPDFRVVTAQEAVKA